ncbi:MAG: autotransporter-associated beta strand repeat-containing protein, partial [Limisphaerales bacterium]
MKKLVITACVTMLCASLQAQLLYWDSNGTAAGAGATPTGNWGTDSFWNTSSAGTDTPGAWTPGATAVFSAGTDATSAFTVTLGSAQTAAKIHVEEGTPTFNGSTLTLNGIATVEVASGRTAIVGTTILAGNAGLTKEGPGTLQINGAANTYTGNTTVKAGAIRIGAAATTFGSQSTIGTLILDGGNFETTANRTVVNPFEIRQNATISKDSGSTTRTVTFTNLLTTSPGVTITLRNPGTATNSIRFTGGAVSDANWVLGQAGDGTNIVQFMGNTNWPDQVFSGTISGPGMLRRTSTLEGIGANTILSGNNTYSGNTEIHGGRIGFGRSSTGNPVTSGPIGTGTLTLL